MCCFDFLKSESCLRARPRTMCSSVIFNWKPTPNLCDWLSLGFLSASVSLSLPSLLLSLSLSLSLSFLVQAFTYSSTGGGGVYPQLACLDEKFLDFVAAGFRPLRHSQACMVSVTRSDTSVRPSMASSHFAARNGSLGYLQISSLTNSFRQPPLSQHWKHLT